MVCLITGSSRGLGMALALACGKRGHSVAVHCKDRISDAKGVAAQIKDSMIFKADARDFKEIQSLVDEVVKKWGRIDVLVNNAGITKEALLLRTSEKDFDEVIGTNLKGAFNFIRAVAPYMMNQKIKETIPPSPPFAKGGGGDYQIKQKCKHIINISSFAGVKGKAGLSAYSASKAGLIGLTLTTAKEFSRYNIMVNAVLPGYMLTDMGERSSNTAKEKALEESLVKDFSNPNAVAEFICRLSETTGITGQVFNLDSRII
ncbi:MAG: SDR family NAD(P)-dependent oxidoreductase [Nitrospirae bacterium]|nr:SDR family NAD(P)-dependent oxidoreductase [Nitrospirota bacterium]